MKIFYSAFDLVIGLESPINLETMPEFIFRSIIGNELKKLTCLFKKRNCNNCDLRHQCAYSVIFETPVNKEWKGFSGRNYASHPFILSTEYQENSSKIELHITMLGKYIDYFPYIYYAIMRGGENGIGKERTRYKVESVKKEGEEILFEGMLKTDEQKELWESGSRKGGALKNYLIEIKSPLRLQKDGKIITKTDYEELLTALRRRMEILCELYGEQDNETTGELKYDAKKETACLSWTENKRWSSRQKKTMLLGGITGTLEIKGRFTPFERSLIQAGEIFHVGKNTAFGMGKIKVREFK